MVVERDRSDAAPYFGAGRDVVRFLSLVVDCSLARTVSCVDILCDVSIGNFDHDRTVDLPVVDFPHSSQCCYSCLPICSN